ncbi:MAG: sulfite exporter TauE/SafE family protein [bacterium]|nr:sulfite exporter TauE/SafE family protein [bacterium]
MLVYLYCSCVFLFAGVVQGLTGFGSGLVAIPLLTLMIDIKLAVGLCILHNMIITSSMAYDLRRHFEWSKILPLLIGSIPGVLLGAYWFKHVNPNWLEIFLAVLLIGYSIFNLLFRPKPLYLSSVWGYIAGFFTGAISSVISAGGPPSIIYATLTGWKKEEMKATLTGFFLYYGFFTVVVFYLGGNFGPGTWLLFAITAPFVFLGTLLGSRFGKRINQQTYLRMVYILLIVMGLIMLLQ